MVNIQQPSLFVIEGTQIVVDRLKDKANTAASEGRIAEAKELYGRALSARQCINEELRKQGRENERVR